MGGVSRIGGAHAIRNDSVNTKLVYLDFGTRGECEIAHLIDAKKMLIIGQTGNVEGRLGRILRYY